VRAYEIAVLRADASRGTGNGEKHCNVGAPRLAEKASKRDLEASRRNLLELDAKYRLTARRHAEPIRYE
jgi:hypothetical protein